MNAREKYGKSFILNPFYGGVKAYKGYFIFGDYVVALGAGIENKNTNLSQEIHTTIDQTLYKDSLFLLSTSLSSPLKATTGSICAPSKTPVWIIQNRGFAYTLLPHGEDTLHYSVESRKNHWVERYAKNKNMQNLPEQSTVLQLWINHGVNPRNDTYAYMVYIGKDKPERHRYPLQVVENSVKRQIMTDWKQTVCAGMVCDPVESFYIWNEKCRISVPCAFLLKKTSLGHDLIINDAQMDSERKFIYFYWRGNAYKIKCYNGKECGKPIVMHLPYKK